MLYQTALKVKCLFAPLAAVGHRDSLSSAFCFGGVSIIILRVCSRSFLLNLRFCRIWQRPYLEYGYNVKVSFHQILSKVMPNYHIYALKSPSPVCLRSFSCGKFCWLADSSWHSELTNCESRLKTLSTV